MGHETCNRFAPEDVIKNAQAIRKELEPTEVGSKTEKKDANVREGPSQMILHKHYYHKWPPLISLHLSSARLHHY